MAYILPWHLPPAICWTQMFLSVAPPTALEFPSGHRTMENFTFHWTTTFFYKGLNVWVEQWQGNCPLTTVLPPFPLPGIFSMASLPAESLTSTRSQKSPPRRGLRSRLMQPIHPLSRSILLYFFFLHKIISATNNMRYGLRLIFITFVSPLEEGPANLFL